MYSLIRINPIFQILEAKSFAILVFFKKKIKNIYLDFVSVHIFFLVTLHLHVNDMGFTSFHV